MFKFGLVMAALGSIILLFLIFLQAKLVFLLIPLFFVVSGVGMVNTSGFSLAMQTQGKNAGSASALLGVTSFAIGGFVSPLVGIGGGQTAIPMGIVMVCTGCGSILSYMILVKRKRRGIINIGNNPPEPQLKGGLFFMI